MTQTQPIEHIYADPVVQIYDSHIKIHKYYFPLATSKTIFFEEIDQIIYHPKEDVAPVWGIPLTHLNNWFPLDQSSKHKHNFIELVLKNSRIKPSFSPVDPERAFKVLWENHTKQGKEYSHLVEQKNKEIIEKAIQKQKVFQQRNMTHESQKENIQQEYKEKLKSHEISEKKTQVFGDASNKQKNPLL